ncbi:ABC transporter permease [Streptomyces ficellus]|uniref:ABC transporter permease n=1 Tax=Streptomyces ficellus TaxID=1977088 RepID=A0A6I6FVC2_9ACTN|nr:ABC transporter permease [Streptomyces ficellus]QGV81918.1 ABC transporter permease [Streptomyces ficellus]
MTAPVTAPVTTFSRPANEPPARFGDLLAAEWIKTRSLRSTPWAIGVTILFVVGSSAVAALADVDQFANAAPGVRPPRGFVPFTAYPPSGYLLLMLVAAGLGALTVVSEYGSGLIRTTTVAVPARGAVVLAKAVVTAALWTVVGLIVSTGSFLVSQAVLEGERAGVPITHPGVFRALAASALLAPVCALVGLGLGVLVRHSAATVLTGALTLLMLPPLFSPSERWSADINHMMVASAWRRLVQNWGPSPDSHVFIPTVPGSWLVYALWPLAAVALAVVVVRRRDV